MKKLNYIIIALALATAVIAGDSVIISFTIDSQGDMAILEWQSGVEGNLLKYKIERSPNNINYTFIEEILPQGNYTTYQYIDDDVMKTNSQRIYYYRIKMIFADGTYAYSEVKSVTLTFSGFQETWGSIKALFK
ncbi:MAG: hypothetical protein HQ591_06325 [candidate division Zixibacteria bacterium]|nr:hypothetical protein [Candidatus Tariuqbacter arcticus]